MKKSEFEGMIREIVQNEIKTSMKRYIQAYVPIVVNEVVSDLIDKRLNEVTRPSPKRGKSSGLSLNEIAEMANGEMTDYGAASEKEWASLTPKPITSDKAQHWDKQRLAAMMGYEGNPNSMALNTIDTIISDKGTPIPINPNAIPEELTQALNKDYRGMLAKMNARTR